MLLKKETASDTLSGSRVVLLDQQLRNVEENLWTEVIQVEKLDDRLRVAGILPINNHSEVALKTRLPLQFVVFCHVKLFLGHCWKLLEPHPLQSLVQLKELGVPFPDCVRDFSR